MNDYAPVRMHLESVSPDVQLGAREKPRKPRRTRFGTETVDNTNPVRPLLPDAPERVLAMVQATGGDVYLCETEAKALQAAGAVNQNAEGVTRLPSANGAPWPVTGQNAVWIAQATAASTCVVSFTADYEC